MDVRVRRFWDHPNYNHPQAAIMGTPVMYPFQKNKLHRLKGIPAAPVWQPLNAIHRKFTE